MNLRLKLLVTLIAGGLAYLLMNMTGQPEIWQLTTPVFVGGIVLVVQMLIATDARIGALQAELKAHGGRVEQTVDRRFAAVNEATALYGRVDATMLRPDLMTRLVTAATKFDPEDDLQRRFADHEINRLAELLEGLDHGWTAYQGEDRDWLLGLTASASKSIDATSMTTFGKPRGYVDEGQFWAGDLGQRYLDSQHRAIDRGVRIRRLFLLDDDAAADDAQVAELIEPHRKIGVETRTLPRSSMDFLLQTNLVDFVLFDGQVSYEIHAASTLSAEHRPVIASVTLVAEKRRIAERRNRFEKVWASATQISPTDPSANSATPEAQS